jgi:hypothetical protein
MVRAGVVRLHILEQVAGGLIDVLCNIQELLGMVVGYHQPYQYSTTEVFMKLVEFGTPPTIAHSYIERVVNSLTEVIVRNTMMKPHYMTHNLYIRLDTLYVVERLSKETGIEHVLGFTMEDEIRWAIAYG